MRAHSPLNDIWLLAQYNKLTVAAVYTQYSKMVNVIQLLQRTFVDFIDSTTKKDQIDPFLQFNTALNI